MTTITEISARYPDTDKNTIHSYTEVYDQLFTPKKHSATEILEIGVLHGGSILTWRDFFPNATITGLDIHNKFPQHELSDRIRIKIRNAYTPEVVSELSDRKYDIMVDDGPHTLESMLYFVRHYLPLLKDDGILVIEDIQKREWIAQIVAAFPEHLQQRVAVYDRVHIKKRYDDILIVLDMSSSTVPLQTYTHKSATKRIL